MTHANRSLLNTIITEIGNLIRCVANEKFSVNALSQFESDEYVHGALRFDTIVCKFLERSIARVSVSVSSCAHATVSAYRSYDKEFVIFARA